MESVQFIGQSSAFQDAIERTASLALLNRPVLVIGERGTGKELIAERIHRLSARWHAPYVIVNCAALPETLLEAELFGHEAGAFTGATRARAGRFEEAHGGTLFLDELATLSSSAQERILRAVEYGEVTRVGSSKPRSVDVRLVGATNADLPAMVRRGTFRADLLDRLSFDVIGLPPLREREGDVALLAGHFGRRMAMELGWDAWPGFAPEALAALEAYAWPGNVRELRNVVERATYRWADPTREVADVPFDPFAGIHVEPDPGAGEGPLPAQSSPRAAAPSQRVPDRRSLSTGLTFREAVDAHERALLEQAMEDARFNQKVAAEALGLTYDQMRHALKRHGMLEPRRGHRARQVDAPSSPSI